MKPNRRKGPAVFLALALSALVFLTLGCGPDHSPLAQDEATLSQAADSPGYIVLGAPRLGKIAGNPTVSKTVSGMFYPDRWGSLEITDWSWTKADQDGSIIVKRVWFAVEWGAIKKQTTITMTAAWGSRVEDVSVAFSPSGLTFSPPATLAITLHGPLTDAMFADGVYHIDSEGHVTKVDFQITKERTAGTDSQWVLTIKIPGFSRYSLGGDP